MKKFLLLFLTFTYNTFAFNVDSISSFEASFTQSIYNPSGNKIEYTGKVYIQKPFYILWKYHTPISKDVFIIDKQVAIIEPDLEQAILSTLQNEINIFDILKNGEPIDTNIYKSFLYEKPYIYTLSNNTLEKIEYKDQVENSVIITFENVIQNKVLDQSLFQYTIPNEYDIIRK